MEDYYTNEKNSKLANLSPQSQINLNSSLLNKFLMQLKISHHKKKTIIGFKDLEEKIYLDEKSN